MPASHLPERLAAGRERDEVAAVLNQKKREERRPRQDAEIVDADAANLHREIDDGDVDGRENRTGRSRPRRISRRSVASCSSSSERVGVSAIDRASGRVARSLPAPRLESEIQIRGARRRAPQPRHVGSGATDRQRRPRRRGLVMSGRSSGIGAPNNGNSGALTPSSSAGAPCAEAPRSRRAATRTGSGDIAASRNDEILEERTASRRSSAAIRERSACRA